jgi:acyl-coenzyme A synthetase/AMP-(fatty) acid ligase
VWAFAYNPTHFAGLQVFFQAVLNCNPMIYIFEQPAMKIGEIINKYGVTHISATPTFYRLRLQQLSGSYESVVRLTSGGEKFEPSLQQSLEKIFSDAKFRNVYAITEAGSLLESEGELFQIPEERSDKIRITEDNELVVHKSLLGKSVSDSLDGDWFHTGDLIEDVDGDRFRFVGRRSDFVNVGGYRVNPHQVEEHINTVDEVDVAVVSARESSVTGHILVAEIQPTEDVDSDVVKSAVKDKVDELERWKQPRVIDVVDCIDQSRSGKRVRRKEK